MKNSIEFRISGRYALFTDPVTKLGGEKCSYPVPTYEAIKGICCSIYWKPTLIWYVDSIRIINPIRTQSKGMKTLDMNGGNSLAIYNYLSDVAYEVKAHFEWNKHMPDLASDRIDGKHFQIAQRMLQRGGRQDVFLGTRDCPAYVEPCSFGVNRGAYDNTPELAFGLMFHGFDYPSETGIEELHARLWQPVMKNGVIEFPRPDEPSLKKRFIRKMPLDNRWASGTNFKLAEHEAQELML